MSHRDEQGRFLPGNKFWEARSSHGPRPKFETADALWSACCEYFQWVDASPLYEDRLVTFQGSASHEPVAKMRAMTLQGLCFFIDIDPTTWQVWKKERADLSSIIARVEGVIYQQKFAGAAADLLNANIIARELGLTDKSDHTLSNPDGSAVTFQTIFEPRPEK